MKVILVTLLNKIFSFIILPLLFLILLIPLLLLPIVTSVHVVYLLLLLVMCVILSATAFHFLHGRKILILCGILLLANILGIVLSQVLASTPPIKDKNGNVLPNSIAVLEKIKINGSDQWITIRGKNKNNPVLLYLGIGGPGAGGMPATFTSLKPLEEDFVVVNWDQPGTGKSYSAVPIQSLTTQKFVDDAYALTNMIRERFNKDKIYVMGLSWGTIVGINLVQQHPEAYVAYVGNGQMVNTVENDQYGYNLALQLMEQKGDLRTVSLLKQYGPPPYTGDGLGLKYAAYNNVLFDYMESPRIEMIMVLVPQFAREYGYVDKVNFSRGLFESFTHLYPQLTNLDFISQAPKLEVPVYFLAGRKDVNAVSSIVERYYNVLDAPQKKLIWVDSGHGATAEELRNIFLNQILAAPTHK